MPTRPHSIMSAEIISELFRSLENTLRDRLKVIEDILVLSAKSNKMNDANSTPTGNLDVRVFNAEGNLRSLADSFQNQYGKLEELSNRFEYYITGISEKQKSVEESLSELNKRIESVALRQVACDTKDVLMKMMNQSSDSVKDTVYVSEVEREAKHTLAAVVNSLTPHDSSDMIVRESPTEEVIEEETVEECIEEEEAFEETVEETTEEATEEVVEETTEEVVEETTEETVEEATEEVVEETTEETVDEATEEVVEETAEEEEEAVELEEFRYRNRVYYRDTNNNVYQADDEGDVLDEIVGTWDPVAKKIMPVS